MIQTYEEALEWIHARLRLGIKPGLKRMEWMLERLDHPERRLKTIHVGGTNGKGSTVTYMRSILQAAGYKIGTFTSPYFEQFNERISVNGEAIADNELIELTNIIKPLALELEQTELGGPTEFEVITAMAIYYFAKHNPVDLVIFEVGLGGRFDSTNVIYPLLSIITNIGLDHTAILGDTYEQIAFEKAGILKNGVPIITGTKQPEALQVIEKVAKEKKAKLYRLTQEFMITDHTSLKQGEAFSFQSLFAGLTNVELSMIGAHQIENASLALMAIQLLTNYYSFIIEEQHIRVGLRQAYWPGRFEVLAEDPYVIIDGAHNEEGIMSLVRELKSRFHHKKIKTVFAALSDKKLDHMIEKLDHVSDQITFVSFDFPRAAKAEELYHISQSVHKQTSDNWLELLNQEIPNLKSDEVLLITGSLYFLSMVKPKIKMLILRQNL